MSKLKVTNIEPQSGSIVHLTGSLVLTETLTARVLRTELTQSVTLFESGSTAFGDDLNDTHKITGSLSVTGSTASTTFSGIFVGALSSSAQIASDITGSWSPVSTSLATRLTTAESELENTLISGAAQIASEISGSSTSLSSSLAGRVTTEEGNVDALQTDSASFSTRITSNESFSSSLDSTYATDAQVATAVSALNTLTASLASTGSNTFSANQIISGTLDSNAASNKLRFLYSDFTDLPSATQYHGMFAHVHSNGQAYFSHAGQWVKLATTYSSTYITSNTTAEENKVYVFEQSTPYTLTLPLSPSDGDSIYISNRSNITTNSVNGNGEKIMGDTQNLNLDRPTAAFRLMYTTGNQGWVVLGSL